jgi:hypothetical protein
VSRLLLTVGLAATAVLVAFLIRRFRPTSVTRLPDPRGYSVPEQIDRADFSHSERPWLVAVFTSATCDGCQGTWEKAKHVESDTVAVDEIEVTARRDLHDKYGIEAVPAVLICDADGNVQSWFLGPPKAGELWGRVAELTG